MSLRLLLISGVLGLIALVTLGCGPSLQPFDATSRAFYVVNKTSHPIEVIAQLANQEALFRVELNAAKPSSNEEVTRQASDREFPSRRIEARLENWPPSIRIIERRSGRSRDVNLLEGKTLWIVVTADRIRALACDWAPQSGDRPSTDGGPPC